jgi:hypothetical protein
MVLTLNLVILLGGSVNAQNAIVESHDPDLLRVSSLQGKAQRKELRHLLTHFPNNQYRFYESAFYYGDQLRPALRVLVGDPKVGGMAVDFLARLAEPEDLRFIIRNPPRPRHPLVSDRWAYKVACSLLDPRTEEEWSFLRSCTLNRYQDGWTQSGAIQTLKLIASPRSKELLEEAQRQNPSSARAAARALEYIRSEPSSLMASNLEELAARVAQTIKIGNWQGNEKPRYSEGNDKALINFEFSSGRDRLIYTATFCRTQNIWRLRGVRESAQVLLAALPVGQRPIRHRSG